MYKRGRTRLMIKIMTENTLTGSKDNNQFICVRHEHFLVISTGYFFVRLNAEYIFWQALDYFEHINFHYENFVNIYFW